MQNWNKQDNDILHLRRRLGNIHYCANKCSPCVFSLPILGHASFWRLIIVDRLSAQNGAYLPVTGIGEKAYLQPVY